MQTENLGVDAAIFEELIQRVQHIPFYQYLGFELEQVGPGSAVVSVQTLPEYSNIDDSIHGGVIMALADAAMATAVRTLGASTTTVQLETCFLRHGTVGEKLTAQGKVIQFGKKIAFCESSVLCAGKEIASIKSTFFRTGTLLKPEKA